MAAAATQNPTVKTESKSAKKKKAAKAASTESEAPAPVAEVSPTNGATESANGDGAYESPYIKELYKYVLLDLIHTCGVWWLVACEQRD